MAVSFVFTLVVMLTAVKMGWAQSTSDAYQVERFGVSDGVNIDVLTSGGSIDVIGKNTDEVTVEMYVRRKGRYIDKGDADLSEWEIDISKDGNTVNAHAKREKNKGWNWNRNSVSISFVVYAPKESVSNLRTSGGSIELENLIGEQSARTSGGSVRAEGIKGDINLKTSGGSITINDVQGDVDANTSGGRISVENVSGDIDVRTSGGSISLESVEGSVEASTSGGSIRASIPEPSDFINLRTSGGSITIEVPRDRGYDLDLDGNRVRADLRNFDGEIERDEVRGSLNGGGIRIKARTSGGSVRLNYL